MKFLFECVIVIVIDKSRTRRPEETNHNCVTVLPASQVLLPNKIGLMIQSVTEYMCAQLGLLTRLPPVSKSFERYAMFFPREFEGYIPKPKLLDNMLWAEDDEFLRQIFACIWILDLTDSVETVFKTYLVRDMCQTCVPVIRGPIDGLLESFCNDASRFSKEFPHLIHEVLVKVSIA